MDGWINGYQVCNIPPGKVDTRHYTVLNPVHVYGVVAGGDPHTEILQKKYNTNFYKLFFLFFAAAVRFCIFFSFRLV